MTDLPPFLLDLCSTNGSAVATVDDGAGGTFELHEWTSWFRIRSDVTGFVAPVLSEDDEFTGFVPPVFEDDGIAVFVHLRDHEDLDGEAIGLHHARLEEAELEAIREAVAKIDWARLPRPIGGDFNAPKLALRYASGNLLISRSFNARSSNFIEAIAPLWRLLDKLTTRTMRVGANATIEPILKLALDADDPRQCRFRVGLRNCSGSAVALTDPRVPSKSGAPRLEIQIGERVVDRDWVSPFHWTTLELPPLPEHAPRSLVLAARKRWELELPWLSPKPGRYELRVRWLDYDGPVDTLPGQIPFMPVPSKGPSFVGSGPYPVRGCCRATVRFESVF